MTSMTHDYMKEVQEAQRLLQDALRELEPLGQTMPDGREKLRVLGATTLLVNALLTLNFRPPAVPCRLDFVAEFDGADLTAS